MKESKVLKIVIVIAVIVFISVVGITAFNTYNRKKNEEGNINTEISNEENIMTESPHIPKTLEEINEDYTLSDAEQDNAFIVNKHNLSQNKNVLQSFIKNLNDDENSCLRVVMETPDSLLSILDIESSGDLFVVKQNNIQMSGDIVENVYSKVDGYNFVEGSVQLDDGTSLTTYSLAKENLENTIDLFAYIQEENLKSGDSIENQ